MVHNTLSITKKYPLDIVEMKRTIFVMDVEHHLQQTKDVHFLQLFMFTSFQLEAAGSLSGLNT